MLLQQYSTDCNDLLQTWLKHQYKWAVTNAMLFKPLYPCPATKGNKNILLLSISHLQYIIYMQAYYIIVVQLRAKWRG